MDWVLVIAILAGGYLFWALCRAIRQSFGAAARHQRDVLEAAVDRSMVVRAKAAWQVGKWCDCEMGELPWYACDRGGWFGRGLPGRCFRTWSEAMDYALRMSRELPL